MTDQKTTGNGDSDIPLSDFRARRRLLKASAAAPLIATLAPGTALAQTSMSCAQKSEDYEPLQGLPPAIANDDNAVRVEGKLWTAKNEGENPNIYEVRGNYYLVSGLSPTTIVPTPRDYRSDTHYFVEYFSVNPDGGAITSAGTYPATQQGTLVSDSCWLSIGVSGLNIN